VLGDGECLARRVLHHGTCPDFGGGNGLPRDTANDDRMILLDRGVFDDHPAR